MVCISDHMITLRMTISICAHVRMQTYTQSPTNLKQIDLVSMAGIHLLFQLTEVTNT